MSGKASLPETEEGMMAAQFSGDSSMTYVASRAVHTRGMKVPEAHRGLAKCCPFRRVWTLTLRPI